MKLSAETFAGNLAIDLVAILVLAYGIYYTRHHRRDLVMACITFNMALFLVVTVLAYGKAEVGLAIGLGLFGALSLIRLRSEELSYVEVAYCFSALALAVINGLGLDNHLVALLLNGVLLATVYGVDRADPPRNFERTRLVLDRAYTRPADLKAELERCLGAEILKVSTREINLVKGLTEVEVRYRPHEEVEGAELPAAPHAGLASSA
jgi:hypothetical protein